MSGWASVRKAHGVLAAAHPGVFDLEHPVPLSLTIKTELKDTYPGLADNVIQKLLRWLTDRRAYHLAMVEGASRIGLDGTVKSQVSAKHAGYAAKRYAERERLEAEKAKAA